MEKALMAVMGVMIGLTMVVAVAQMVEAQQPVPEYTCPICGDPFWTYQELYDHFVTEHPAEDLTIIWE